MKTLFLICIVSGVILQAEHLHLKRVIDATLSHHPDIRSAALQIRQGDALYKSARADYLPQITLQGEYDPLRTYVLPVNGVFHTVDDDGYSVGAVAKQKIWDFSTTRSKVAAAKKTRLMNDLALKDATASMVYEVTRLYELMVLQQQRVAVRHEDAALKEALYHQATALMKQGLKTQADASRFLSSWYGAKEALAIAQSEYDKARVTLSLYMGEPIGEAVILEPTLDEEAVLQIPPYDLMRAQMLQHSPRLQLRAESIEKNRFLYRSAKASRYGSVDAVASYTHQNTLNSYDATFIGVSATIPLYTGGRMRAESERARLDVRIADEQYKSALLTLETELHSLLIDLNRYQKSIEAKTAQLEAARQTQQILQARYGEGLSTYIELLDAVTAVLNAHLGLLEVRYAQHNAMHRMHYLTGTAE